MSICKLGSLHSYNPANICDTFCRAQKILQKLAQKQTKKIYDNPKYLRYILRIAKISVNISDIFCKLQKIPLKIPQKKEKNLWLLYVKYVTPYLF